MNLRCLFGHKYDGCKCTKCGKTRDDEHLWLDDCEKCSRCGQTRNGDVHRWYATQCPKCEKFANGNCKFGVALESVKQHFRSKRWTSALEAFSQIAFEAQEHYVQEHALGHKEILYMMLRYQWKSDVTLAKAFFACVAIDCCFTPPDEGVSKLYDDDFLNTWKFTLPEKGIGKFYDDAADRVIRAWKERIRYANEASGFVLADIAGGGAVDSTSTCAWLRVLMAGGQGDQTTKDWSGTVDTFRCALELWRVGPDIDLPESRNVRSKKFFFMWRPKGRGLLLL